MSKRPPRCFSSRSLWWRWRSGCRRVIAWMLRRTVLPLFTPSWGFAGSRSLAKGPLSTSCGRNWSERWERGVRCPGLSDGETSGPHLGADSSGTCGSASIQTETCGWITQTLVKSRGFEWTCWPRGFPWCLLLVWSNQALNPEPTARTQMLSRLSTVTSQDNAHLCFWVTTLCRLNTGDSTCVAKNVSPTKRTVYLCFMFTKSYVSSGSRKSSC